MEWEQILTQMMMQYANYILILLLVVVLIIMYKRGKKEIVIDVIRYLVAKAEKELGSKTGIIKKGKVISELYKRLPIIITILFSQKDISDLIDKAVIELDKFLEGQENNLNGME